MNVGQVRFLPSVAHSWSKETDVVIIGAGAAGLSTALETSRSGHRVILMCKGDLSGGSTSLAQGGLAAVVGRDDSLESHVSDTMIAGAGLSDETAVRQLVAAAPSTVAYLTGLGARFDAGALGLEGGHSHRRIVHAGGDAIGAEVHRVLSTAVLDSDVDVMHGTVAIDILRTDAGHTVGVVVGRRRHGHANALDVGVIFARAVIIATGGLGQVFSSSTNPTESTGDGVALAARAGAAVSNVEFIQFHPTVLYTAGQRGQSHLITEAIRGAGATIIDARGDAVMRGVHPRGDLAPRDVVSLAMYQRMHSVHDPLAHLWLDARGIGKIRLERAFPTITQLCRQSGVDPVDELVPVAPGAHYACGGVQADLDGRTCVPGLYAIGEAAATGVHGANRLASNSLTEAVISGRRLAGHLSDAFLVTATVPYDDTIVAPARGRGVDPSYRVGLADHMSSYVGVVRNHVGLQRMMECLVRTPDANSETLELSTLEATNLHTVSQLVTYAASLREESRGCHRRSDFPDADPRWEGSITLQVVDGDVTSQVSTLIEA
jgi:L-aspartate oxidase